MANALARISFTLDLPESVVEKIVGRPDDGSDEWREAAFDSVEERMREEFHEHLDHMTNGEPDVDVDL